MTPIELRSDNSVGVSSEILVALSNTNAGSTLGYGADPWTDALTARVREVFEHPGATVHPVVSGTAANAVGLSALTPPWGAVLCHDTAHILVNEGGATSMLSGGAVMRGVGGADSLIDPAALRQSLDLVRWGDNHHSQPAVLSLTVPTDHGTTYRPEQIRELADIATDRGLAVHVDGARLANAVAALGCAPADLTWRAGVSLLSLGAIKNGGMSADAIVSFDGGASAEALHYRLKRAGHVSSKMRFLSAQLTAYLSDDLWLRNAAVANRTMARLVTGLETLGLRTTNRVDVNMAYLAVDDALAARWEEAGLLFYRLEGGVVRFVTSFCTTDREVDDALTRIGASVAA